MADLSTDNPAGRLHQFFQDLHTVYQGLRRPAAADPRVSEVLAQLWGLRWPQQRAATLRLVADVSDLPDHVAREITALSARDARIDLDEDLESLKAWRSAVAVLSDLSTQLSTALAHVTPATQKDLRTCARHLHFAHLDPAHNHDPGGVVPHSIEADALRTLTKEVNDLQEQVLAADLDPDLKAYLSSHVDAMREALLSERLRGPDALADLYARTTVDLARHRDLGRV